MNERDVAQLPGVQAAVAQVAARVEAKAQGNFAKHDRPGGHRIGMKKRSVDYEVYLEGPAPGAVEFGHITRNGSKWVPGIHVLGKAVR